MTIRFAAARPKACGPVSRVLGAAVPLRPGNDNGWSLTEDSSLVAALRHFAQHGIAAAEVARQMAGEAQDRGDSEGQDHWLAVCRALDRRLAYNGRLRRR